MVVNLRGTADPVPVVWFRCGGARRRQRAMAPASARPRSTTGRRVRASGASSVMRVVLRGLWLRTPHQPQGRPGVRVSRSASAIGPRPRDLEHLGDLHERQPEVVVQDEDRPLVDREPAECPFQFVAVGDDGAAVRAGRPIDGQDPDVGRPLACPLRLVVTGMDEDPMDPTLRIDRSPADVAADARQGRGRSAERPRRVPGRAGSAEPPRRANC